MSRKIVLIVTSKEDSHADLVIYKLNQRNLQDRVIRLNTEDLWLNTEISTNGSNFEVKILDSQRSFNSEEILSVWFRRPKEIEVSHIEEGTSAFIKSQCTALLRGLYFCTHDTARWVNPLPSLHRARIKLQQIKLAKNLGMKTPKTLVANNPQEVLNFFEQVPKVCTKSLDEASFEIDGHIFPLYTHIVNLHEVKENLESIKICPTLFQEYIEKLYELRVNVIGDQIFALAMYSQDNELSQIDFRGLAPAKMKQELVEIPDTLKTQIFQFVKHQGLAFSAMDFIVTPDYQYIFLENNCNGQWQWVDQLAEGKLSEAMIDLLLKKDEF